MDSDGRTAKLSEKNKSRVAFPPKLQINCKKLIFQNEP